jgi:ABC-type transport system substrate-binding protein
MISVGQPLITTLAPDGAPGRWSASARISGERLQRFMDSAESSNVNLFDFTYLMYRPLYWFGEVGQPVVNTSLSLAAVPVISGRTVTITLKHYMWSNGAPVTAQDGMFWINLDRAVP